MGQINGRWEDTNLQKSPSMHSGVLVKWGTCSEESGTVSLESESSQRFH